MSADELLVEHGLLSMPEEAWREARRRATVIAPLAAADSVSHEAADSASKELGLSRRQVYTLVKRYRQGSGLMTDLAPARPSGGRGAGRLPEPVESVIQDVIGAQYAHRQKRSLASVHREVVRRCKAQQLTPPARNTVARRVAQLPAARTARARGGPDAARTLQAAGGTPPSVSQPLERVQIDHTVVDVMVVDERDRQPIGRPYLTVGIDVFSRCLPGLVVTLEPPSAVSVGLCLAQMCCDKRPWLTALGVDVEWPMSGKPGQLYVDNATEFKSEALRRGCEQHGIEVTYRPGGQPHYGGIVERVIGTAMARVHELPGTTFSNPAERGSYDSDRLAVLTLRELEQWLVLAVATYHGTVHSGLGLTPAGRWAEGVAQFGVPPVVTSPTAFLVDFLPVMRRTLTRTGFVLDHVHYFSTALKPWIARRHELGRFVIRRDPRDISRVWVLEPNGHHYVEVPYRTLSHPAVTLWEHRQAVTRLRQQGRDQVDEQALFAMIDQMRNITDTAGRATRSSRRDRERRRHLANTPAPAVPPAPPDGPGSPPTAAPFADIEEW